jgi:hypothetical protein
MKAHFKQLKKILRDNKEDLKYLFIAGIPALIVMLLTSRCLNYSNLY